MKYSLIFILTLACLVASSLARPEGEEKPADDAAGEKKEEGAEGDKAAAGGGGGAKGSDGKNAGGAGNPIKIFKDIMKQVTDAVNPLKMAEGFLGGGDSDGSSGILG
ncbi:glycine/glutamate-rich protein sgp1-like [Glossina fuscipes fuscipes]